jgi:hypothetical protein
LSADTLIDSNSEQSVNAELSILTTDAGISIFAILERSNEYAAMLVTSSGITVLTLPNKRVLLSV